MAKQFILFAFRFLGFRECSPFGSSAENPEHEQQQQLSASRDPERLFFDAGRPVGAIKKAPELI